MLSHQDTVDQEPRPTSPLDRPVFPWWPALTLYRLLVVIILLLTIVSRFYDLGARTMSHDEVNHVVPAHSFSNYVYDPVTHGPFQFHAIAFSYFVFGESDFSARVPAALFGVAVVAFTLFAWRPYMGRAGSLIASVLFLISPYILFYSRYTRNEIFIVFWGLVMLWLFLRYLEDGQDKWLYWLTFITAMHYTDKATAYIFTAEAMLFLLVLTVREVLAWDWKVARAKALTAALFPFAALSLGAAIILYMVKISLTPALISLPAGQPAPDPAHIWATNLPLMAAAGIFALLGLAILVLILRDHGLARLRRSRAFNLLVFQALLVLPLLTAIPLIALKLYNHDNPLASQTLLASSVTFVILTALAMLLGMLWNKKVWPRAAALFWAVFVLFYSTFFMHGEGFFKGIVGALAYWMSQQDVVRGTQPLYYYAFLQVPMYEYLPALGVVVAILIGVRQRLFSVRPGFAFVSASRPSAAFQAHEPGVDEETELRAERPETAADTKVLALDSENISTPAEPNADAEREATEPKETPAWYTRFFQNAPKTDPLPTGLPILALLVYWSLMSLLAFTIAGERMPWLTTHITMPMILTSGYALGYLVSQNQWKSLRERQPALVITAGLVFFAALVALITSVTGATPPLQGKELPQLQATSQFLMAAFGVGASAFALRYFLKGWKGMQILKLGTLVFFALIGLQTARTAWRAAYINYDNAKEFLVYAHSTRDMKDVLEQVETISKRLYGDLSIKFAYDDNARYPFWWYARDFPNSRLFASDITRDLRDYPVILVGTSNFDKIRPVVQDQYYEYTYHRMWWPTEVYRNQTLGSVWRALTDKQMRSALWTVWFDRDYSKYAAAAGRSDLTLATWSPSDLAKFFVRKDIAAQIWEYGIPAQVSEPKPDPYAAGTISLDPERVINLAGDTPFNAPRGMATAPDGSLYLADSRNHRIVHLDSTGKFIQAWGSFGDAASAGGMFNEPWGLAVAGDGSVFVADTWNHRIQAFDANGSFLRMWSSFDTGLGTLDGFWGPRDIAIGPDGNVYVTDTGKQRVVIFTPEGQYVNQFGGRGLETGRLDEPVGLAIAGDGTVYIADTWNKRVQAFEKLADGSYRSKLAWEVQAWTSESLDNKPYIALDTAQNVYITDPDYGRILRFDQDGNFRQLWGGFDNNYAMGVISGVTVGQDGLVWVTDASSNLLLGFQPPEPPAVPLENPPTVPELPLVLPTVVP